MPSWPVVEPASLGTLAEVQERLSGLFPDTYWRQLGNTSFGRLQLSPDGHSEFQITPDDDGQCRWLTVRRVARDEVQQLCRLLGLVAVDQQTMELIRP
jgi:hypothetical protein